MAEAGGLKRTKTKKGQVTRTSVKAVEPKHGKDELKKEDAHHPYHYVIPPPPPPHPITPYGSPIRPIPPPPHDPDPYSPPHPPPPLPNDYDYGFIAKKNPVPGIPGKDYPLYNKVPYTGFQCSGEHFPGFYADVRTGCQVWHYCQLDGRHDSFLCPNGTVFNQKVRVCDWWYNVDCPGSPYKFDVNADLYRTQPKKRIYISHSPHPVGIPIAPPPPPPPPPPPTHSLTRVPPVRHPPPPPPYGLTGRKIIALPVYRPPIARVPLKPASHVRRPPQRPLVYYDESRIRTVPVYRSRYIRPALTNYS